jgi:hypothetical protein
MLLDVVNSNKITPITLMWVANRIKARMTINHKQKINSEKVNEHRILFTNLRTN